MSSSVAAASAPAEDLEHILAHTGPALWAELGGKRIFITGGTGFFGRWLLESCAAANERFALGIRTVILSRNPAAFRAQGPHLSARGGFEFVRGDVRNLSADLVASQLGQEAARFDYVIHAATESNTLLNVENPLLMFDTVVQGTRAALEFAGAAGARRFLFTSSGAVYGRQPQTMERVAEDYVGSPDLMSASSAYAEGKRAAEVLCACYAERHGLETVVARCFSFFGPHLPLDTHLATANFIRDALSRGPIRVSGTGADVRSYLYAADLAIWLWTILVRGQSCRAYNVGSEHDLTIAEWAREVARVIAPQANVAIARRAAATELPTLYVPATTRAQQELGLAEHISREEGLRRFQRWSARQALSRPLV